MVKEVKIILAVAALSAGLVLVRLNFHHSVSAQQKEDSSGTEGKSVSAAEAQNISNTETKNGADDSAAVSNPPSRPQVPQQKPEVVAEAEKKLSFKIPDNLTAEQKQEKAIDDYAQAFFVFANAEEKPETLVKKLADANLKPLVVQDFNDTTGKMVVIKTDETLPGTRYLHVQYFEDENKKPFLQHMSVEFQPGTSLDKTIATMRSKYPKNIAQPKFCTKDFAAFAYGDYTVWCQSMNEQDLKDYNPFNAHDVKKDVGTVRCAQEQNPHPQDDVCGGDGD